MDGLHRQDLNAKTSAILHRDIAFLTCLGHLRQRDTDRIVSISVAPHKVAKASKEGDIATQFCGHFRVQISPM